MTTAVSVGASVDVGVRLTDVANPGVGVVVEADSATAVSRQLNSCGPHVGVGEGVMVSVGVAVGVRVVVGSGVGVDELVGVGVLVGLGVLVGVDVGFSVGVRV